jgi:pimeloyl-ACP methyl ester carboxylesterase
VPLDRTDASKGTLQLFVARRPADRKRRGTIISLAGGPGESAVSSFGLTRDVLGSTVEKHFDIVSFDARGTGRSGLVNCPEIQRDGRQRSGAAAAACVARLGDRRGLYNADDQVLDIEAVRQALGVEKLDLYGTSFGTKAALRYAQDHPDRVGRLLLDSTLLPSGPSATGDEVIRALPRVLTESCPADTCPVTKNVYDEVRKLVGRLRQGALRGTVFDAAGRSHRLKLGPVQIFDLLLEGDFLPELREAMPAAIVAANRGDAAPLLRLYRADVRGTPSLPAREFSSGAYAAGSCEDIDMPWDYAADPRTRIEQARANLTARGPDAFAPFDVATILQADYLSLCRQWPAPMRPPADHTDELPNVPMLFVAGRQDLRTPLEDARALAATVPKARLLAVRNVGHAVLVSDPTGCSQRIAQRFLLRLPHRTRCAGPPYTLRPLDVPPRRLSQVDRAQGLPPRIGRTLTALDLTLDDIVLVANIGASSGGGLRGGRYGLADGGLHLHRYSYVPGVTITTRRRKRKLIVYIGGDAAARGFVRLSPDGSFRGTLGGKRVRGLLSGSTPGA